MWERTFQGGGNRMPVITGTGWNDILNGTAAADDIRALGGDDVVRGGGGDDEIDGGAGNDRLEGEDGSDLIRGGDGDDFLGEYYSLASSIGSDRLYGDGGNDNIVFYANLRISPADTLLDGGIGEDVLEFQGGSSFQGDPPFVGENSGTLIGGAGNDRILTSGGGTVAIDAGDGDDLVRLSQWGTEYEINLGAGSDLLLVTNEWAIPLPAIVVTDFAAGDEGDTLGLVTVLTNRFYLDADTNPFANGNLRLVQRGADTVLQTNGIAGPGFLDFIILRNIDASTLTAHNLGGYTQDGSPTPAITFTGTAAADNHSGNSGDDLLQGLGGVDWLYGGAGNDRIEGGDGNDMLTGELGDDVIYGGAGNDQLISETGVDRLFGEAGMDGISVDLNAAWTGNGTIMIDGGADDDFIRFTDQWDRGVATILGGEGDDSISINGGRSFHIEAGSGNDSVQVQALDAEAFIRLGTGSDRLDILGGGSPTSTNAFTVADFATGASGDTMMFYFLYSIVSDWDSAINPFAANYLRLAQSGDDTLLLLDARGEAQFFNLVGRFTDVTASQLTQFNLGYAPGQIAIAGGNGADVLSGTVNADELIGLGGDDVVSGGGGADRLAGGAGNDTYYVDGDDLVFEGAGEGYDAVYASASYTLRDGMRVEQLSTNFHAGTAAINLAGNELANTVYGNAGANVLRGAAGDDSLYGFGGDDILYGGNGNNYLGGGLGNDWYYVDSTGDVVVDLAGQGSADRVFTSASWSLTAGTEIEILSTNFHAGTAAINLTGNAFANIIYGNAGDNILDGKGGNDSLSGGLGNDWYYVDSAGDIVDDAAGQGSVDRVFASTSWALGAGAEIEILSTTFHAGTSAINLTGNAFANTIYGNAGDNILDGKGGNDSLSGGLGNDWYYVDSAGDIAVDAAGQGAADRLFASVNWTLAAGAEIEILSTTFHAGTAAIDLAGNEFANTLYGNAGANALNGGAGSDSLYGYGGSDRFGFADPLGNGNIDLIGDFVAGVDKLALSRSVFTGLPAGALATSALAFGAVAQDADDRIIYDQATGRLYFDADGSGGGAALQFATLAGMPTITASDFIVI
jgi:Ca2+-binding RTX toxin-like protein